MPTFTQIFYHIIFSTRNREPLLISGNREKFFRYTWGILKKRNCFLYRINCVDDHVHMLISLHPSVALADLIKDIKVATSRWIKDNRIYPKFESWQDGYGAFTCSISEKETIIEYIKGQEEHHKKVTFYDEFKRLLVESGVEFDDRYLK